MERTRAVEIASKTQRFSKLVERLMLWDENKSIRENMVALGFKNTTSAYQFRHKFGLRYKNAIEGYTRLYTQQREKNKRRYVSVWDSGKTIKENARLVGVTLHNARAAAVRYKLPYLKITKYSTGIYVPRVLGSIKNERNLQIIALRRMGMSLGKIGGVMGISRQAVSDLLRKTNPSL